MPRHLLASGLIVVLSCSTAYAQRSQTASEQEQLILGEYWTVVRKYQSGGTAAAIKEMSTWPQDRIAKVQATQFQPEAVLNDLGASKAEWKPTTLRSGAMLHTEVALELLRRRDLSQFQFHAGIADGWLSLADNRTAIPGGLRSRWNVAIARVLLLNGEFALADGYLDRLNTKIANDPAILLALGTAKESRASRIAADATDAHQRERDELRTAAAGFLERALTLDATLVEAHLRLARLAIDRGDAARAEKELAMVTSSTPPPTLSYLRHLWLGQIREQQKQWNDAAQLYVEAVKAQPDGQSAYVALAHILHATGQPAEAGGVMERWLTRGVTSPVADPWWIYPLGLDTRLEVRFDAIIAEVKAAKETR
jgi:tetratricopeptide (TPR) repeat protein